MPRSSCTIPTTLADDAAVLRPREAHRTSDFAASTPSPCSIDADWRLGVGGALAALYRRLESPVVRADILRAAILYLQGGVYLDLDTVTTASPRSLARRAPVRRLRVHRVAASRARFALALGVGASPDPRSARKVMRRMPQGWRAFRHVERFLLSWHQRGCHGGGSRSRRSLSDYLRAMPERLRRAPSATLRAGTGPAAGGGRPHSAATT